MSEYLIDSFNPYDIKHYDQNHRYMSKAEFGKFKASLHDFGDLSPIIINLKTGNIIGGHRRDEAMDLKSCKFEWSIKYDEPDHQGTVALGYVVYNNSLYNVRAVYWDVHTEAIANIAANKIRGSYDLESLINDVDPEILKLGGFSEDEITQFQDMAEEAEEDFKDKEEEGFEDEETEGISIIIHVEDNFELAEVKRILDEHLVGFSYKIV